jgi:hypothetical protein
MSALGWILFVACNIVSGAIGWLIRSAIAERAEFRAQERRDWEWDEQHGIRHG